MPWFDTCHYWVPIGSTVDGRWRVQPDPPNAVLRTCGKGKEGKMAYLVSYLACALVMGMLDFLWLRNMLEAFYCGGTRPEERKLVDGLLLWRPVRPVCFRHLRPDEPRNPQYLVCEDFAH